MAMAKPKSSNYDESSIQVIRVDIEKIKKKFESYIGYRGLLAFIHITKEILQNAIDEAGVKDSSCDTISLSFDEKTYFVDISDNGRGIPHGSIVDIMTVIQSSGKFDKGSNTAYVRTSGLNGVGATATNALSVSLEVWSVRDGVEKYCRFEYGWIKEEKTKSTKKPNGTRVRFLVNKDLIDDFEFDPSHFVDLCETMSYLSPKTKFNCNITDKKGETKSHKFLSKNGIIDLLNKKAGDSTLIDPIYISYDDGKVFVEVAMTYSANINGEDITSFSNYCTTIDHGTHVIGFKQGLTSAFTKFIPENVLTKRDKDLTITGDDCREGLVAVINGFVLEPSFVGQVKEKVNNPEYIPFARKTTMNGLFEWFKRHEKEAKKLGDYIKNVAKLRLNAQSIKDSVIKTKKHIGSSNILDLATNKYKPATGRNPNGEKPELYIIEGESAGGTAKQGRFKWQALYYLKGVPKMVYGMTIPKMMASAEIKILGEEVMGGIGSKYTPDQCPFSKIIFATDADIDGHKIGSSLSVLFCEAYPQLVEAGMVYKVQPPLYKIKSNGKEIYLSDNKEYTNYIQNMIGDKIKVKDYDGNKINTTKLKDIMYDNMDYLRTLNKLSKRFVIQPSLLENLVLYYNNRPLLKKYLKAQRFLKFEEKKDSIIIKGVFNKEYHIIILNDKLFKNLEDLYKYIHIVNKDNLYYYMNNELHTLGEMLTEFSKFEPPSKVRFKGLGEMGSTELKKTTLDPDKRVLLRLKANDVKKALKKFAVLHSDDALEERKAMMAKFRINIDDIDN